MSVTTPPSITWSCTITLSQLYTHYHMTTLPQLYPHNTILTFPTSWTISDKSSSSCRISLTCKQERESIYQSCRHYSSVLLSSVVRIPESSCHRSRPVFSYICCNSRASWLKESVYAELASSPIPRTPESREGGGGGSKWIVAHTKYYYCDRSNIIIQFEIIIIIIHNVFRESFVTIEFL